ncbi:hypothetical protein BCR32DRAFT_278156 [Anaeromyces robustus]|uniref:Uncharacterized protein n=1 Tax=Anaeromyces robustus TaxID=1754192 RepID=A0A1Y1XD27_9FUNG|nr:hypothetical protein BCR32DRAFT_278156 [Anaeromyces robustus]|eukprot:ORX83274.1 hypothetical protein BCR32DRAFT_278156 [Anaeromyces robustus]
MFVLRHTKLIDEENNWIGTNTILIQIGDLMERCCLSRKNGHNPQTYWKIRTKCDGKLIIVDIDISRYIGGGYYGYLEILNNMREIWARYLDKIKNYFK